MRALKTKIKGLNKSQFKRLKELTSHAKNLYNQTLWTLREAYEATGKYFSYPQMDKAMKQVRNLEGEINYKSLKSKVAQQTLRRVDQNFRAFFNASRDFVKNPKKYTGKPRPPSFKQKQHDNLVYDFQAFQIKGSTIVLEKGLEIQLPKPLIGKNIKQIEIIPKHKFFQAVFVFNDDDCFTNQKVKPFKTVEQVEFNKLDKNGEFVVKQFAIHKKVMSIDLGLNNLATCVTNGVIKPFIIDGKRLKSVNAYYNKRKASMQSKLSKRGKKWSRQLQSLTDWRNAVVNDYMHKATSYVVKTCVKHGISKVVVGDVVKSLNSINLGKRTNQNFVN
jgi:putative transposase